MEKRIRISGFVREPRKEGESNNKNGKEDREIAYSEEVEKENEAQRDIYDNEMEIIGSNKTSE